MIKIKATIYYKIKASHPNIGCLSDWRIDKEYRYSDTYTIDPDCFGGDDDIEEYIKEDMLLVAGGGYDWKHIYDVRFEMERDVI